MDLSDAFELQIRSMSEKNSWARLQGEKKLSLFTILILPSFARDESDTSERR